jgi:peptidoglycan/LPS O-acetylase OafA/YrhL
MGRTIMSENEGKASIFWVLAIWGGACILTAFQIPQYDMGFDGIKIYLVLCALMLAVLLLVRTLLIHAKPLA